MSEKGEDMKDKVKEIQELLIKAEASDGHLLRRDCWALLYEIFALRKAIEKIYEYLSPIDTPEIGMIVRGLRLIRWWEDEA